MKKLSIGELVDISKWNSIADEDEKLTSPAIIVGFVPSTAENTFVAGYGVTVTSGDKMQTLDAIYTQPYAEKVVCPYCHGDECQHCDYTGEIDASLCPE